MGQQQLLIIVLALMLAGLAVYAGLRMSELYNQSSNMDQLSSNMHALVGYAETYAKKPVSQGGGAESFLGLTLTSGLLKTPSGEITYTVAAKKLTFTATGVVTGKNAKANVKVYGVYTKGVMTISDLN